MSRPSRRLSTGVTRQTYYQFLLELHGYDILHNSPLFEVMRISYERLQKDALKETEVLQSALGR